MSRAKPMVTAVGTSGAWPQIIRTPIAHRATGTMYLPSPNASR